MIESGFESPFPVWIRDLLLELDGFLRVRHLIKNKIGDLNREAKNWKKFGGKVFGKATFS